MPKKLKFKKSYSSIPKSMHPIVIGSLYLKPHNKLFIDLRSIERAIQAILFFDKYLNHSVAKVTHAAVVNRIFDVREGFYQSLDVFFNSKKVVEKYPEDFINEMNPIMETDDIGKKVALLSSHLEQEAKNQLPEVEKFPVHFYEEGIVSLESTLKMRQIIALKHWQGNKDFTFFDIFFDILNRTSPRL